MKRYLTIILLFILANTLNAQNIKFDKGTEVGSKLIIEALPYSNGINKYYFNKEKVKALANFLKSNPKVYIEVNCFSDFSDTPMMNLMATADQAIDIKNFLMQNGIAGSRINTIGNGDMFPIVEQHKMNNLSEEEQKKASLANRRIEVKIIKNQYASVK